VKKLIIASQIVVVVLIMIKALFLTEVLQQTSFLKAFSLDHLGQAIAQTPAKTSATSPRDVTDDALQKERDLMAVLQKKQKDLDAREIKINAEEQKMLALKKEITEKIDTLKALEAQLSTKLDAEKNQDGKRLKELAKVYEAVPPQKAAAMLDKLDTKTAAGITINMKRERAGLIWGYLNPQKAVAITNEITKTAKSSAD
jgi:flagellar motility protein MotE (MotC chaperone)